MSPPVSTREGTWAEFRARFAATHGDEAARACDRAEAMGLLADDVTAVGGPVRNSLGYRLPVTLYFGAWDQGGAVTLVTAEGFADWPAVEQRDAVRALQAETQPRAPDG